jgi:hypothetical protein
MLLLKYLFGGDATVPASPATNKTRAVQKSYHKKTTGLAAATAKRHAKDHELKLFGSCFCPFVQRVWISMELKDMSYQYIEVDPYKKPANLIEVNPKGLVPAIRHGDWGCHESTVLMEYVSIVLLLCVPETNKERSSKTFILQIHSYPLMRRLERIVGFGRIMSIARSFQHSINISKNRTRRNRWSTLRNSTKPYPSL